MTVTIILAAFTVYLLVRFAIACRCYRQASRCILKAHREARDNGVSDALKECEDWMLVNGRYLDHVLDVRKWTFRQFYPELA